MSIQKHYHTVTLLGVQIEVYWDSVCMPCVIEPKSQFIGLVLGHWNLDIDWA